MRAQRRTSATLILIGTQYGLSCIPLDAPYPMAHCTDDNMRGVALVIAWSDILHIRHMSLLRVGRTAAFLCPGIHLPPSLLVNISCQVKFTTMDGVEKQPSTRASADIKHGQIQDADLGGQSSSDLFNLTALGYKPQLRRNRSMFTLLFQSLAIAAVGLYLFQLKPISLTYFSDSLRLRRAADQRHLRRR